MKSKQRVSASVDADLVAGGHAAVADGHAETFSAWVNEALRRQAVHDARSSSEVLADARPGRRRIPGDRAR
jgi:hypothetical protein